MAKSNNSDKFIATLIGAGLAALVTGGVAATYNINVPVVTSITVAMVFIIAYNSDEQ